MITRKRAAAACAALLLSLAACGSDSTGPGTNLDAASALQSLKLTMATGGTTGIYGASGLAGLASQLDRINVTIDGKSQSMYALGLRESYPAGTCEEDLFVDPLFVDPPGQCTPPQFQFALILWQSHSADAPPDRLALIAGDVGPIDFGDLTTLPDALNNNVPGFAIYTEGQNEGWVSVSGTLTSIVTSANQSCAVPLPPFAKSGSCSVAAFDEEGTINLEPITGASVKTLVIPRQTIHGIWQTITETQPVTVTGA
jgi:hypothetical protein